MIKNNIKYFIINIFVSIIALVLSFFPLTTNFNYDALIVSIVTIISYLIFGFYSKYKKSALLNLLSFSLVFFVGLLIWIICFIISPTQTMWLVDPNASCWGTYILLFSGVGYIIQFFQLIFNQTDTTSAFWLLPLAILPTLLFWCGVQIRIKYDNLLNRRKN